MSLYEIPLKIYINQDGTLYNKGVNNVLKPIFKLSNAIYKIYLITPISSSNILYVSFQKADGSKSSQQLMSYVGTEVVDETNWSVFTYEISNTITNVSEKQRDNTLSFSFNVSDGNETPRLLNSAPIYTKCQYSIIGEEVEISQDDLNQILASVMATLNARDKTKVFAVNILPPISSDNIDYLYILNGAYVEIAEIPTEPLTNVVYLWNGETRTETPLLVKGNYYTFSGGTWSQKQNYKLNTGNIYRAQKLTDGSYDYIQIAYGYEYIGTLYANQASQITKLLNAVGDTTALPQNKTIIGLINEHSNSIANINADISDLNGGVQTNYQSILALTTRLESTETEVASINGEVSTLKEKVNKNTSDITANKGEISQVSTEVEQIDEELSNIKITKLNKSLNDVSVANSIADSDYVLINSGGVSYKILFGKLKEIIGGGGGVNHYKGDFLSYDALVEAVPTAVAGDYAFVNTEDELVLYIWDTDDNTWKQTTSTQYVASTTFAEFQKGLLQDGTLVAKVADNYLKGDGTFASIVAEFNSIKTKLTDKTNQVVIDNVMDSFSQTASQGNLTAEQLATLTTEITSFGIVVLTWNSERYYLMAKGHESGYNTFTNIEFENAKYSAKTITINMNNGSWVLNTYDGPAVVEITGVQPNATQGTLSVEQMTLLQRSIETKISFNNEIYRLNDNQNVEGMLVYTHNGYNEIGIDKYINITISTRGWTLIITNVATTSYVDNKVASKQNTLTSANFGDGLKYVNNVISLDLDNYSEGEF